jgi:glycosyltransferase involved in cell wall biosynthesis
MLSGSPWDAAAHRQHALARELARDVAGGFRVLFVDPPTNRPSWRFSVAPVGESIWRASVPSVLPFGRQLPPVNWLGRRIGARLLRRWLAEQGGARLLWVDEDLAAPVIGRLDEAAVIYDATDLDWTFTRAWNRWNLQRSLRAAVAGADLVLASSSALPPYLPGSRTSPVIVANGCDPDAFRPDGPSAPWMDDLPRPVVGYLGAIDTRAFDGELVAAVARRHPEWTFVLVGPASRTGCAPLAGLANVVVVGAIPFADAPAVVRGCDVGIVPYRVGGLIDYVHPKKCFEYLAAGKPVVATALPALQSLDAPIRLASGPDDFGAAIGSALQQADSPAEIALRRASAAANTWRIRGDQVRTLLAGLGAR